jgi:predicted Zn-dependent protease
VNSTRQSIAAGFAAYKRGELAIARQHLAAIDHHKAIHLLGLVESGAGNLDVAASLLDRAAAAAPDDHEIAHSQGRVACQRGRFADAEAAFRRALRLKPDFSQASISLGRLLIDQNQWEAATAIYDKLLRMQPTNLPVRYGYATVQLAIGAAADAERIFDALIDEGNDRPEIRFMRARARLELRRTDEAISDLWASYNAKPAPLTLKTLAGTLWMHGDRAAFDQLIEDAATDPGLTTTAAELVRQGGFPERTLRIIATAQATTALPAEASAIAATAHIDTGNAVEAERAALQCLSAEPGQRAAAGSLITALLMQGRADEAMQQILPMRKAEPHRQHWIAYEATALRLLGSRDYEHLVDMERFVRPYTLPTPDGFDSLAAFNAQFLAALERWHLYQTHPLDQSLRGGSQTPQDLTFIDDPVVRSFVAALDGPIRQYMRDVGSGNDHPLTSRNTGRYKITGCWSVRLSGGGWHVNHVHPEGWISSAYYAAVPEETMKNTDKAGWIKFGEPPFETVPPSPPQKWIRPTPGILVLFPSFLWHGTEPIHDGSVRVTAPFDAVPV